MEPPKQFHIAYGAHMLTILIILGFLFVGFLWFMLITTGG